MFCGMVSYGAVDPDRHQLWVFPFVQVNLGVNSHAAPASCMLKRFDYRDPTRLRPDWVRYNACPFRHGVTRDPTECPSAACAKPSATGVRPLIHLALARSEEDKAIYASGTYGEEGGAHRPTVGGSFTDFTFENGGQALIIRRLRPAPGEQLDDEVNRWVPTEEGLAFDWDLDLRAAGCGRRVGWHPGEPRIKNFVARVGDNLLAYCFDSRPVWWSPFLVGDQGYLVRIPLDPATDAPIPANEDLTDVNGTDVNFVTGAPVYVNYRYVRTSTLPGYLDATVDPASGNVLLVTDGKPNGNAVWVFDPRSDRFIGVATGGIATQPRGNTSVGVDMVRGRVYLTTQQGLLMVPTRTKPLSGGLLFDVPKLLNPEGRISFVNHRSIGVVPSLHRLFVPVNFPDQKMENGSSSPQGARYLVLEDDYPDDPPPVPVDPDANTAQVPEDPATAEVVARGQATASGAHVVVTGGLARTVDQVDPACHSKLPVTEAAGNPPQYVGVVLEPEQGNVTVEGGTSAETSEEKFNLRDGAHPKGSDEAGDIVGNIAGYDQPGTGFRPFASEGCAADQVINRGHRELFLAATVVETGSGSGSVARAAGLSFGANDVTAGDVNNVGSCGRGTFANFAQGNDPNYNAEGEETGYRQGCDQFHDLLTGRATDPEDGTRSDALADPNDPRRHLSDTRDGTTGRDGMGFPLPAALCGDYGSAPDDDVAGADPSPDNPEASPLALLHDSDVECNAAAIKVEAHSTTAALTVAVDPGVFVAKAESTLFSVKTPDKGQYTVAYATAQGVRIGPLVIREVKSLAISQAHGHTGTAATKLVRRWCGLALVEGSETDTATAGRAPTGLPDLGPPLPSQDCVDPTTDPRTQDLITTLNQQLTKVHLGVPPANGEHGAGEASPGGFQAVLAKSADHRAGDLAVNDDDTHTVAGLEVIVYNDGAQGRNRIIVQLAGVHTEARYGIVELPDFSGFDGGGTTGEGETTAATGPIAVESDSGVFTPPGAFGEDAYDEEPEHVRVASPVLYRPSRNGGILQRLLRPLADAVRDAIELLVTHPREFALLFVMWSLFAAPGYLLLRRRSFAKTLLATARG